LPWRAHEYRHCRRARSHSHGKRHEESRRSGARSPSGRPHAPQVLQRRPQFPHRGAHPVALAADTSIRADMIPNTLSIAGVDPSGGAGVLADVKAMSALGAYGMAVIAALTAQNTRGVTGINPVPPEFVALQIDTLFTDVRVDAVKIGMLGQQGVTRAVAERLAHWKPAHIVLDPVMIAKSGDALLERSAIDELRESLLPLATVLTP